ncbi:hypothetical protein M407DRAFT_19334 [Tulasnella calospora MUT 4182]|uniref:GED domain-containing protein n=1 Tax=Tulasnella calospora MUT 4182 TaxID=1051891 RepID=A0A0C3QRX9_9AGAM|nr:hypothetical protein M407DRAFT_19334 [Tulasnella calospora MUT 4182]
MFRTPSVSGSDGVAQPVYYVPGVQMSYSPGGLTAREPSILDRSPLGTPRTRTPASEIEYVDRGATPEASRSNANWQGPPRFEEPRMGDYFQKRRDLLDILKSLHSTGIQNELDLPQIVVIGSQSVGKSSLIESMSVNITSGHWNLYKVSNGITGRALATIRDVPFGPTLYNAEDVEKLLRRAQRAILRPELDPTTFLDDSDLHVFGVPLTFSGNCVCIHVEGPNIPDLYFYDLPGIIANVGDGGNEADIKLVEQLAKSYIKKPNCIVLLVISCETDFENQGAGRFVLKDPALRQRTIGVLTKVDRIEFGGASRWLRMLRGEYQPLVHGWYCVKQRDLVQLQEGVTWEEARSYEAEFFQTTAPWADLDHAQRARLGSEKLAERLGGILSKLVSEELPGIRRTVSAELKKVNLRLQELAPPEISDPRRVVITLLRDFTKKLSKHIEGIPPMVNPSDPTDTIATGLLHSLNEAYERFRVELHKTAPQFRPWSTTTRVDSQTQKRMLDSAKQDDDAVGLGMTNTLHADEVMDLARRSRTRELPGNYPFSVKERLILESVQQWSDLSHRCFNEVTEIVVKHIIRLVDDHFKGYNNGGLKETVSKITSEQIVKCSKITENKIDSLFRSECSPYTQNEQYFLTYKSKMLTRYKIIHQELQGKANLVTALRAYNPSNQSSTGNTNQWSYLNNAIANLANFGITAKAEDFVMLLPQHDLTAALDIMAEVRAYFQVAYKRFGDNVPKLIDADFVQGIDSSDDGLDVALMSMDLSTEKCMEYLQEPRSVIQERTALAGKKQRLEAAQLKLERYYRG